MSQSAQLKQAIQTFNIKTAELGYGVSGETPIDYGVQVAVENGGFLCKVNFYGGKKGLSIVVTGKKSPLKDKLEEIKNIILGGSFDIEGLEGLSRFPPPPWIGTDESGKGDFIGPLCAAGVYAGEEEARLLTLAGVKDSKAVADAKIYVLAAKIKQICKVSAVVRMSPQKYNDLMLKFKEQGKNLNHLLSWAHAKVIEEILLKKPCKTVIVDKFASDVYIRGHLGQMLNGVNLISVPKAEENPAVAAASVLARESFLNWITEVEKRTGMSLPKGAGPQVNAAVEAFAAKMGRDSLPKLVKLHFKNAQALVLNNEST